VVAFARTVGEIPWSLNVPNLKAQPYRDTRGPGREDFRRLLEAASNERDRVLLRLLHGLGLRRSEVVAMDLEDVDLEGGSV
jgi:integrase